MRGIVCSLSVLYWPTDGVKTFLFYMKCKIAETTAFAIKFLLL